LHPFLLCFFFKVVKESTGFLKKKQIQNDGMRKCLAKEVAKLKIVPVRHQIIIEEIKK